MPTTDETTAAATAAATAVRTGRLEAPGATLHYEVRGRGPLLVMVPGGSADAGIYDALAAGLADRWTVVAFDPRGYSRSTLHGPTGEQLPGTHSEDVARLIELLSPDGAPAAVFGSSSSAIVALDLLSRRPGLVGRVVAHEPPLVELLPDPAAGRAVFAAVRESFLRDGVEAAMATMAAGLAPAGGAGGGRYEVATGADEESRAATGPVEDGGATAPPQESGGASEAEAEAEAQNGAGAGAEVDAVTEAEAKATAAAAAEATARAGAGAGAGAGAKVGAVAEAEAATVRRMMANLPVFLGHVLCSFSGHAPDLDALRAAAPKLVVGVGRESRALLPAVAAERLAQRVGSVTAEFPGGHVGLTEDPVAFGARLREVLLG
ncbi:alpha/beta fold hydrolase [Streptomyces sp. RB110-1]|uniref:alpha/beta fold hydrolase n=1 Tax=unclassified Streptomyces TaxID=2593676 RepID=UPI00190293BC|nr:MULTISPECIES: alpha/beta fold hydrolase [unclassified Streptomyces]MBK0373058.1 alpha/beta fold hydrolase [Streptomyces sp. RB110-1]MBK0390574.1 alpha/beta fold hydrolase [Streptomyces sp. RB110-2]